MTLGGGGEGGGEGGERVTGAAAEVEKEVDRRVERMGVPPTSDQDSRTVRQDITSFYYHHTYIPSKYQPIDTKKGRRGRRCV